jgi:hypothetical protein
VEIAIRISDINLHFSLARNAFDVFSLCIVKLGMPDHCGVLWTNVHVVVTVQGACLMRS